MQILLYRFVLIISSFLCGVLFPQAFSESSVNKILDWHGFSNQEQHDTFTRIFQCAGIIEIDQTLADTLSPAESQEHVVGRWVSLVAAAQEKFFSRAQGQERWQVSASSWMNEHSNELYGALETLGFFEEKAPCANKTDAICVLGATYGSMCRRVAYAQKILQSCSETKAIILLAGERQALEKVDGTVDQLQQIAKKYGVADWHTLTETYLMRYIWDTSVVSTGEVPVYIIDTPKRNLSRPTTQTTIEELMLWLEKHPEIQHITFVTTQPYILYQKAVIAGCLAAHNCLLQYEVVGDKKNKAPKIHTALEGLASYLWASLPVFLVMLHNTSVDVDVYTMLGNLYQKNPLLYGLVQKHVAIAGDTVYQAVSV